MHRILAGFLLSILALSGQSAFPPLVCFANSAALPIVRASGIAEALGEIVILCQGGDPARSGTVNFQVFLNTGITSRILNPGLTVPASEALLLVDEPASGTATPCAASQMLSLACPAGANAFQGVQPTGNAVLWLGIPFVAPGNGPPRIFRIVNLRGNISALPPSGTLIPTMVEAYLTITGAVAPPLMNPAQVVGYAQDGLAWSLRNPLNPNIEMTPGSLNYQQCVAHNAALSLNAASSTAPDGAAFILRVGERFSTAFRKWTDNLSSPPPSTEVRTAGWLNQDAPGVIRNSENQFFSGVFAGQPDNMGVAGYASSATRFAVLLWAPPGLQIHAPAFEMGKDMSNSRVRLVAAEPLPPASDISPYVPLGPASAALGTYFSPSMTYVYEITTKGNASPGALDSIDLLFYTAHPGKPYVGLGTAEIGVHFWPISMVTNATRYDGIPRFATHDLRPLATVTACPAQPKLAAALGTRSGPQSARVWPVKLSNAGAGAAANARVTGFSLLQTFGAACTPALATSFPLSYGSLNPGSSAIQLVTINFTGCPVSARFSATIQFAADGGYSGSATYNNLYR